MHFHPMESRVHPDLVKKKTVQQKKKKSADWGSSINLPSMVTRL